MIFMATIGIYSYMKGYKTFGTEQQTFLSCFATLQMFGERNSQGKGEEGRGTSKLHSA